jgi:hypothetical protein
MRNRLGLRASQKQGVGLGPERQLCYAGRFAASLGQAIPNERVFGGSILGGSEPVVAITGNVLVFKDKLRRLT